MRARTVISAVAVVLTATMGVAVAGVGVASAQTGGSPGVTKTTISVGGVAAVTNQLGQPYADGFNGVQAYFNYINAKGGVYGHKFKLVARLDDQDRASGDVEAVRELVEQDKVFAVMPVVTDIFDGASYLASKGVPTFGWNINSQWNDGPNLFGEKGSYLCFTCPEAAPPYLAQQLGVKNVAILAYTAAQSQTCASGMEAGFKQYGFNVVLVDDSISFGFTDLGSDVDTMKAKNVQFVGTCMDIAGEVNAAQAIRRAGLPNVKYYAPEGYAPSTLTKYGNELNGVYFGIDFWPFEDAKHSPELTLFVKEMNAIHEPITEQALSGWINADLLYKGIKLAGPNFTQKSVIDAINTKINGYTANGLRPPVDWAFDGHGPPGANGTQPNTDHETCTAYELFENGKFVPQFGKPGQPFVCNTENPLPPVLNSTTLYYRPPKPSEQLPTTATVPTTSPAVP
jgi:ABC-type branched-subunit amino acid transport system substrate-binding protein